MADTIRLGRIAQKAWEFKSLQAHQKNRVSISIKRMGGRAWLNAPHLKCGIPQGIVGSNPTPSAINICVSPSLVWHFVWDEE